MKNKKCVNFFGEVKIVNALTYGALSQKIEKSGTGAVYSMEEVRPVPGWERGSLMGEGRGWEEGTTVRQLTQCKVPRLPSERPWKARGEGVGF
jgi:hypothetical protein